MASRAPDRVRVSTHAYEQAHGVLRKFPEIGSVALVYRIAAMLSLRRNGILKEPPSDIDSDPDRPVRLPGVFEMSSSTTPMMLFPTIVQLLADQPLELEDVYQQVRYHIHLGSSILSELSGEASSFEEFYALLINEIPPGRSEKDHLTHRHLVDDGSGLYLGTNGEGNEVYWRLTDTATVENPHACIIGLSGQGKAQFVLDLLYQLRQQNEDLSFTILDYKGDLSEAGSPTRQLFESNIRCNIVVPGISRIPSVPFVRSPSLDSEQYALSVTDLISRFYSQLGAQQRLALREVMVDVMSDAENSSAFGFEVLGERLRQYYDEKGRNEDGLTEVMSRLQVLRLFEEVPSEQNVSPLLSGSLLVRLNELAADTLPAAFLLINRLYDEMKRLPDAPRRGSVVQLRHVLFIDEAHHYLSQRSSPLARIIREGRSKGVAVFLATQTVSDLAGPAGADYREFISNSFFFKSNILSNADIRAMVPTATQRINEVVDAVNGLGVGEMIYTRNLGRNPKSSVLSAVQYYRRT